MVGGWARQARPDAPVGAVTKVPEVVAAFWVVKVLTTGMGEAASDALVHTGGTIAVVLTGLVLVASFVAQFRVGRYNPAIYWFAVVMVSIFGTMAADIPHRLGLSLWVTSAVYSIAVAAVFVLWYRSERTLSFSGITAGRREVYYWAAVLVTFALGTAVGDLTADVWGMGNFAAGVMFAIFMVVTMIAARWLGLNAVAAFWIAYIFTRPLGASFADWMGHRGLHLGNALNTGLWSIGVLIGIVYFAVSHKRAEIGDDDGRVVLRRQ